MAVLGASVVVLLALVTASVAESKGQPGLPWFVLGLFFPLLSLAIAALLRPNGEPEAMAVTLSVEGAARSSPVARALHESPSRSPHELTGMVGANGREVLRQLSALEQLDLANHDASGRWSLTSLGAHHLGANSEA